MSPPSDDTVRSIRPPLAPAPAPEPLPRIGEFEILAKLGEGSFGLVYLARQTSLGREVALKICRPDEDGIGSIPATVSGSDPGTRREGQLLAGLEHDHIVKVFSEFHDSETGSRGLCLQYVPGPDLGAVIRQIHAGEQRPGFGTDILDAVDAASRGGVGFDPAALRDRDALAGDDFAQAVCRIGARLAEALAFAHARGILHCDIKPANILVTPYGRPMLADFNVAFDQSRCRTADGGGIGGTVAYMAPEHRLAVFTGEGSKVDERCDVFSLGVVLHELATGKRPATDKPAGPPALDGVPRELAAVIRRCLDPEPAKRYQSAGELAISLDAARQLLAARRALPPAGRVGRWVTASPVLGLALAAVVPHLVASAVNIAYNAVQIDLDDAQTRVFGFLVPGYNLVAYPLCVGTVLCLLLCLRRGLAGLASAPGPAVDELRGRVVRLGWWVVAAGAVGWLPGGLLFPLVIDLAAGPVGWAVYAHYAVSFTLAGFIGVVFSFLAIEYVVFRALLPHLGNPDTYTPRGVWAQVRPLTVPFDSFLVAACAVPLTGAVLLVALGDEHMTLGFRLLVGGLIGLGVAGVGIAERLTRKLRSLAAVWHQQTAA